MQYGHLDQCFAYSFRHIILFNTESRCRKFFFKIIWSCSCLLKFFKVRVVVLPILTLYCCVCSRTSCQNLLKSLQRKEGKRLKLKRNKTLWGNKGEAKIFKEYLKGEIYNFEELKWVKMDEMSCILCIALRKLSLFGE